MKSQITNPDAVKGKALRQVGIVGQHLALVFDNEVAFYDTWGYLIAPPLDYAPQDEVLDIDAKSLVALGIWTLQDLDTWQSLQPEDGPT